MSTTQERRLQIEAAFKSLCDENPPKAFAAITIGEDLMVNFATLGLDTAGTLELLNHMIEYIKQKEESEDEFGRTDTTKIH
jgi:hypothetical protein